MMGRYDYGFPEYVSVAQKRANAAQKLNALKKKNPEIQPVVIEGRSLSRTWWGKSWNENLERYADYSNRIGRGRSYVRLGAVLDLRIEPGKIHALVQGSQASPYQVAISIQALNKNNWNRVKKTAEGQLDTLAELLAGKFPKPLQEVFFAREEGLFPGPKEIDFDCSCPDWASMCKHVAAALYGVGARLDANPSLFFKLRKIKMDDLITQAVKSTSRALLKKAKTRSSRVLDDANLTDVFGIKLDKDTDLQPSVAKGRDKGIRSRNRKQRTAVKSSKKTTARQDASKKVRTKKKMPRKPTAKLDKASATRSKSPTKSTPNRAVPTEPTAGSFIDIVVSAIPKRRKAMRVADICARVDLSEKQVKNAVARAVAQGKLTTISRGAYART